MSKLAIVLVAFVALAASATFTAREDSVVREHRSFRAQLSKPDAPATAIAPSLPSEHLAAPKYTPLLTLLSPAARAHVEPLLVAREAAANDMTGATEIERRISLTLNVDEYAVYERLREADRVHADIASFAAAVSSVEPLTEHQRNQLLLASLKYEDARQTLAMRLEVSSSELPAMEDAYARDVASQGLSYLSRAFTADARLLLSETQYRELAALESTQLGRYGTQDTLESIQRPSSGSSANSSMPK